MNWIDEIFDRKVSKTAEQTDAAAEFQKKAERSEWLGDVMEIDEVILRKEADDKMAAEIAVKEEQIQKQAAYDAFQTTEETLKQDYSRDASILSDSALSEMIAEVRGHNNQDYMENFKEYHEQAKKDVKSNRKSVEKELLENVGMSAQVDWKKSFEKYKKNETPKHPDEKDLYKDKLEKVDDKLSDGASVDAYAETDEKHIKSMEGVGREENERTDVTKEAVPVQKEASLVRDPDTELRVGTVVRLARTVMTKEGFLLPMGSAWEITGISGFHYTISANGQNHTISSHDTPKFDTLKKNASQEIENRATREEVLIKIAECGSPWEVTTDKDGNQVIAKVTETGSTKESVDATKDNLSK